MSTKRRLESRGGRSAVVVVGACIVALSAGVAVWHVTHSPLPSNEPAANGSTGVAATDVRSENADHRGNGVVAAEPPTTTASSPEPSIPSMESPSPDVEPPPLTPVRPPVSDPVATVPPEPVFSDFESQPTSEQKDRVLRQEQIDIAEAMSRAFPTSSDALYLTAIVHNEQGHADRVIAFCEKALLLSPDRGDVHDMMGRVHLLAGKDKQALECFEAALAKTPDMPGIHFRLGRTYLQMDRPEEAVAALRREIEAMPKAAGSYRLLGEAQRQLEAYDDARKSYEAALALRPEFAKAHYGLAMVHARLGNRDKSREHRQLFAEQNAVEEKSGRQWRSEFDPLAISRKSTAHTHFDVGRVYARHGFGALAEKLWLRAAVIDPRNTECRSQLAMLCQRRRQMDAAWRWYREVVTIEPENPLAHLNVGFACLQLKQAEEAEKAFRRVMELAPDRSEGYAGMARAYLQSEGKSDEAKTLAERAVALAPIAPHYFLLAQACQQTGDPTTGLSAARRAMQLEPQNAEYRRTYQQIQAQQ